MAQKKGDEHWAKQSARIKAERDAFLDLLKEIHKETKQAYYCDVMAINRKIEQAIKGK
jgi:hypothetical protein